MKKEDILKYFELLDKYTLNNKVIFNNEELELINKVNDELNKDPELSNLFNNLRNTFPSSREVLIDKYLDSKPKSLPEEISKTFGIDVSKIEHKILDTGVEIFYFYDNSLGKEVVLENKKDGRSLTEILKEAQEENKKYQGNDNQKNTTDILRDKRLNEDMELKMIPVENIDKYLGQVKSLSSEDYKKLFFLVRYSTELDISYINIENMIGLSSYGKIYEVTKDKFENFKVGEPKSANYNEQDIDTSERINNNESLSSSYEDIPNVKEEITEDFESYDDDIKEKVVMFYENPSLLNNLGEIDKEIWTRRVEVYRRYLVIKEQELEKSKNKPYVKTLKKEEDKPKGYVNMSTLIMMLEFTAILVVTYFLIKIIK